MKSFIFDKENKEEQIFQISYSIIFNNYDYKNDIFYYDQGQIIDLKYIVVVISYQEEIINDDIYYISIPNSSQIFSFQEDHQQFKEVVYAC